jgi:type II secretory pathway component GspD/PulD (secretin)
MNRTLRLFAAGALTLALVPAAFAQSTESKPAESKPAERAPSSPRPPASEFVFKTYYLSNIGQQNDANEILIALRNMLEPWTKLYLISSRRAIEVSAPPDQQALAQKIIADIDRPQKTWRLTYTLAESDGGKRIGVQHFAIVVAAGQRTVLKQGNKIPVITGTYEAKSDTGTQTQFQYLDIGMNFDATVEDLPGGLYLKTKVEQSSLADEHMSGPLAPEPIVRQTSLEGTSVIAPGKPLTLGSLDVLGSTRHIDIEVVAEPVS